MINYKKNVQCPMSNVRCRWLIFIIFVILLTSDFGLWTSDSLYAQGFQLGETKPKIITPNGDHKNDIFIVPYETDYSSQVDGKILTLNGSFVANMLSVDSEGDNPKMIWNGKDSSGKVVPSGIYIYQIEAEGKVFNGTVVVAK
ncbi:MAG: gliding motility-associated C-terminal domain-containing protein [Elusimicrobia bacterium]|nr:gliding motility-associated C-terminal domain-containing protein [Elusimicrobiota bacterium]